MEILKVTDRVHLIIGENKGRYPYSNSLFIKDEKNVLIDTGIGAKQIKELTKDVKIDIVVNSHFHEDHIAFNKMFSKSKICAHELDAPAIMSIDRLIELYGPRDTMAVKYIESFIRETYNLQNSRVDMTFRDGFVFQLGELRMEVVHTPGHSAGHCCFLIPEEGVIFLADIDLTSFGPWYGCVDSDVDAFLKSIEKVKKERFEVAVTSHKNVVFEREDAILALDKYASKIFERERKILDLLTKPKSLDEIAERFPIYGKPYEPKEIFLLFEKTMIKKHLKRLIKQGLVGFDEKSGKFFANP
ncbi:MAG: MBL fold metallo-hydrolase [Candidatus Baldrarchaeia archaeon]